MNAGILSMALLGAGTGLYLHALRRILAALFWPRVGDGFFALALLGAAVGAAAVFLLSGEEENGLDEGRKGWIHLSWGLAALFALTALADGPAPLWFGRQGGAGPFLLCLLLAAPVFTAAAALFSSSGGRQLAERSAAFWLALGAGVAAASLLPCLHPRSVSLAGIAAGTAPALLSAGRSGSKIPRAVSILLLAVSILLAAPSRTPLTYRTPMETGYGEWNASWRTDRALWCGRSRLEAAAREEGGGRVAVNGGLREFLFPRGGSNEMAVPASPGPDGTLNVLAVGFPAADHLGRFLQGGNALLTVLESEPALPGSVESLWPEVREARAEGRLKIVSGNPRWFLQTTGERYDLVVVGAGSTPAAYVANALGFDENYLYTVEAFRRYVAVLEPEGLLYFRRPGTGRVVSTLREAMGGREAKGFDGQVVVLGRKKRLVSECYFRPAGFSRRDLKHVNRYARKRGLEIFTSPETGRKWSLYFSLVRGDRLEGYYFSSPQDMSPAHDRRPFFNHFERVILSPPGMPLPEEKERLSEEWDIRIVPPGDRTWWSVVIAGFFLASLVLLLPLAVYQHRTGLVRHVAAGLGTLLLLGCSVGTGLRALVAYARWFDPLAGDGIWVAGLFFMGVGCGWAAGGSSGVTGRRAMLRFAALTALFGVAGYPFGGRMILAGPTVWALFLAALGLAAGSLAGTSLGAGLKTAGRACPGATPLLAGTTLLGVVVAWAGSNLLAADFGFPLLWVTAAVLTIAAFRTGRFL